MLLLLHLGSSIILPVNMFISKQLDGMFDGHCNKHRVCRIKTGHSNLVSCFGPRMRALAKVFYRGESRGKIPCQRPNPRAGLNPNYDTISIPSLQNSQNKCQKS